MDLQSTSTRSSDWRRDPPISRDRDQATHDKKVNLGEVFPFFYAPRDSRKESGLVSPAASEEAEGARQGTVHAIFSVSVLSASPIIPELEPQLRPWAV